jgi:class 3 adenylate cyclase
VQSAESTAIPWHRDLGKLRQQLGELVEHLAKSLGVQAASLYIPVLNERDDETSFPRAFAFVAVYNIDPVAAQAILKMRLVESWTIVGECWTKGTVVGDNALQGNVRHVASYDKQSGFAPVHTLATPVRWQGRPVGVLQLFNKTSAGDERKLEESGFTSVDRKDLAQALSDTTDAGIAGQTHYFLSNPDCVRFLGLQDEVNLENAVIMFIDLTRSSSLYGELPLLDAARLINRFNENVYHHLGAFGAVVERFNGDGTMVRFHFGGFAADRPEASPAFRAVCAAAVLVRDFKDFKSRRWRELPSSLASAINLRTAIAFGPVVSTNVGPRQFQAPTVMGQCVNRSARMVSCAPRDRNVVLVDDHVRKALLQIDREYESALREVKMVFDPTATGSASLAGHEYFEVSLEPFRLAAAEIMHGAQRRFV